MKVRKQIIAYVAGQLAACTEADPAHPDRPFKVLAQPFRAYSRNHPLKLSSRMPAQY
jgi:hypothetical protein